MVDSGQCPRTEVINLSEPPRWVLSGGFDALEGDRTLFVQPPDCWSLYHYEHANGLTVNSRTYLVEPGDFGVIPPAARVTHARGGVATPYCFLSFDMPGTGAPRAAVPHVVRGRGASFAEWVRAGQRMVDSLVYLRAYAWNFMCQASDNLSLNRADDVLYDAEAWILANLNRRFSVAEMGTVLGVSTRHLLRAFRREHGVTVQEYIIQKRVQEAARLLTTTNDSPKEIAAKVGVPDLQHFNKLIRTHTGASPRAFRAARNLRDGP